MIKKFLKEKWIWLIYIIPFGTLALNKAIEFFSLKEPAHYYYWVAMIFSVNNHLFPSAYVFAIAAIIMNTVIFVFLWFYVFKSRYFSAGFIAVILLMHLASNILGSSYEWATVRALYYQSASLGINTAINFILCLLPSYLAMTDYIVKSARRRQTI